MQFYVDVKTDIYKVIGGDAVNSGTKSEHFLEFRSLCRAFEDGFVAVDNFNLTIKQGEFVTFLGPSGLSLIHI